VNAELTTAWMLGCVCGFFVGVTVAASQRRPSCRELMRDRAPDWRRSFSHENTNRPSGSPPLKLRRSEPKELFIRMDEGRTIRGNGNGGPTTPKPNIIPKPQPAGGRLIIEGRLFGGYQPRPQQGTPNPPPSEP
jgi:hypothetical protein